MARSRLVITAIDIELHIEGQFVASWDKLPMFNYPKELKPGIEAMLDQAFAYGRIIRSEEVSATRKGLIR
jgi:hypothetical protein